ncbi:MAG: ribose 5-phosphate isomerase B [Chloroflexi bacterium]|nr:ribose 5-phosphate isomerase B [Chloroflexota bacterium]
MRIAIGCDHRGLEFKQFVMKLVADAGHVCHDFGCYSTDSVDYPDIAQKVGDAVAHNTVERGILICGTGLGMSIAANKIIGVRAALCRDAFMAGRARQHNDANILCLGAEYAQEGVPEIVRTFLITEFEGERHQRRVDKITGLERPQ